MTRADPSPPDDDREEQIAVIPRSVLISDAWGSLPARAQAVYPVLALYAQRDRTGWTHIAHIAELSGYGRRSVTRALSELHHAGLAEIEGQRGGRLPGGGYGVRYRLPYGDELRTSVRGSAGEEPRTHVRTDQRAISADQPPAGGGDARDGEAERTADPAVAEPTGETSADGPGDGRAEALDALADELGDRARAERALYGRDQAGHPTPSAEQIRRLAAETRARPGVRDIAGVLHRRIAEGDEPSAPAEDPAERERTAVERAEADRRRRMARERQDAATGAAREHWVAQIREALPRGSAGATDTDATRAPP